MDIILTILLYLNSLIVVDDPFSIEAMKYFEREMKPYYSELGLQTDTSNSTIHDIPAAYWSLHLPGIFK